MSGQVPLNFGKVTLAPGVRRRVSAMPQIGFKPTRLIVVQGEDHAVIENIEVGGTSQLTGQPMSAQFFSATAVGVRMDMPGVRPGEEIALIVSSPKGGDFAAAMLGERVDGLPAAVEPLVEEAAKVLQEAEEAYEPGATIDDETGEIRRDDC